MEKVKFLAVPKPNKGRRFAISDIHGCSKTFKALLKSLNLKKEDQLFLLGDLINRGPSSEKVLDKIIKLQRKGIEVYMLKGNHEDIVLKANMEGTDKLKKVLSSNNSLPLSQGGVLIEQYKKLLDDAYHYIVLDKFYLVHAGFDFSNKSPFEDTHSMMYIKEFKPSKRLLEKKQVVLGHSPKAIEDIVARLKSSNRKIHIDNGCINIKNPYQGNLVCLNLDTKGVIVQPNLEA